MTALSTVIISVLQGHQSAPVIPFDCGSHHLHDSFPVPARPVAILRGGPHSTPWSYLSSILFLCLPSCVPQITNLTAACLHLLDLERQRCSTKRDKVLETRRMFTSLGPKRICKLGEEVPCRHFNSFMLGQITMLDDL